MYLSAGLRTVWLTSEGPLLQLAVVLHVRKPESERFDVIIVGIISENAMLIFKSLF